MAISKKMQSFMSQASWIRKMFEEGNRLRAIHGAGNVYDFSLGNPNVPPPSQFNHELEKIARESSKQSGCHGYMPQSGFPFVLEKIAAYLAKDHGTPITAGDVMMTCGAAGALNVVLKSILDPDDEVIVITPFFVEYRFYIDNHGGRMVTVSSNEDFTLDLSAIEKALTARTKAVIVNFPNNPTGQIYSKESLGQLGQLLRKKSKDNGASIFLISDEPYRKIVYDNADVPSTFNHYEESIIVNSYSKELSIPGERIGYIAVHPTISDKKALYAAMMLANRILGFVNAPALMQRIIGSLQGVRVNIDEYKRKRDLLCRGLDEAGYQFITPPGTFYLFPKTPIPDDVAFVRSLQEERILVVPGSGFMAPGHFRISFCVEDSTIVNSLPGFKRTMEQYR